MQAEPSALSIPTLISWRGTLFWSVFIIFTVSFMLVQLTYSNANSKYGNVHDISESNDDTHKSSSPTSSTSASISPITKSNAANSPSVTPTLSAFSGDYPSETSQIGYIPESSASRTNTATKSGSPSHSQTPSPSLSTSAVQYITETKSSCITVASYNVRDGIKEDYFMSLFMKYMSSSQFDIVALQELNGWTSSVLSERGKLWGHNYTVFLQTETGYHLGITSRLPFETIRLRTNGFWHGMIHIRMLPGPETVPLDLLGVGNYSDEFNDVDDDDENQHLENIDPGSDPALHLVVSHLDPHNATRRLEESHHIDHQSREHSRLLVMGDLNALSTYDATYYQEHDLYSKLVSEEILYNKFLYQPMADSPPEIDYRVMEKFYTDGQLEDLVVSFRDEFRRTVPTLTNEDLAHAAPMRLDYILASPHLYGTCTDSYVDDAKEETHIISDHFPVVSHFCF